MDRRTRPASASGPAAGPQLPGDTSADPPIAPSEPAAPGGRGAGLATAGDAGPGTREALSGLVHDPRMPIWIVRAGLAIAVGVAVSILLDWRIGLTAGVLLAILDTVHKSRITAVTPAGVRVTSAQRRTRRRLRRLSLAGYRMLHARAVPGSDATIDHLVIGPAGVFAVDSERWSRRLPLRATQGQLFHGPYSQTSRLRRTQRAAAEAARLISVRLERTVKVRPAMVIYGAAVPWAVARISGVDVVSGRRLRRYLRAQARASRAQRLDAGEIERIYAAAAVALPPP